ncbi:MAG: aminoglycoside phosphotransferase family protein [Pseudonocardiales bacterium]|nr:aminoglycoside phosphotransferase family protein [Pseudonocardiales bacterium]
MGYAGRSMVFFAPHAVLKVYTHRASERAHREVAGIELAARHAPGLRVSQLLSHDDVPGGLSWVATTRLPGSPPSPEQIAASSGARRLGRITARLHAIPGKHLGALAAHDRRIRELPPTDPAGLEAGHRLLAALGAVEARQWPRCERGFVHGDLSSRNVLLPPTGEFAGVIDLEGCGLGCVYDDLATLVMQDGPARLRRPRPTPRRLPGRADRTRPPPPSGRSRASDVAPGMAGPLDPAVGHRDRPPPDRRGARPHPWPAHRPPALTPRAHRQDELARSHADRPR